MKTYVLGDIHGAFKALQQVFDRSGFQYDEDRLIALGDACDGWPQVRESVDELLKIKNLVYIMGNHDVWALEWALKGRRPEIWISQGGSNTISSYNNASMPKEHVQLFQNALPLLLEDNRVYVHGGIDSSKKIEEQELDFVVWDRDFLGMAYELSSMTPGYKHGPYEAIFLGHTPTLNLGSMEPLRFGNVWALDTGAGWNGKLTIMDVETKKFWQSDIVTTLYPEQSGRR